MISASEIQRNIILASILEPIPNKPGCTTRLVDSSEKAKLEYFLIAGVNIGQDFYRLAERIEKNEGRQPTVIFDIAHDAQVHSYQNRQGGKVNFGIIELLVPIVVAQLVYGVSGIQALEKTQEVLKNTSQEDVHQHYLFRQIAKSRSTNNNAHFLDVKNIYEYFIHADKSQVTDQVWHPDYIGGMQYAQIAYTMIIQDGYSDILGKSIKAYTYLIEKFPELVGLVADNVCIGLYLALCDMGENGIIL